MTNILFVCSQNKLPSPMAEAVFADTEGWSILSGGLNNNTEIPKPVSKTGTQNRPNH